MILKIKMSAHIFATGCVKDWATRNMALVPK